MASAKFSAFEFASEEFNSELAQLVNGFTQHLVRIIQEECVRKGKNDSDGESSMNSSPFPSPEGKAPRKKAPAPKRGRPSKEETGVVIDPITDISAVTEDLLTRAESVRSSSKSPRSDEMPSECMESVPVCLDTLMMNTTESADPVKKGKGKADKALKEKKEKAEKAPKAEKVPKEKKEKVEKAPKAEKVPKEKKEKAEKAPKEKKEPKGKKGKKGDDVPSVEESLVEDVQQPTAETVIPENVIVDDDDFTSAEIVQSDSTHPHELSKLMKLANVLSQTELVEEDDYAKTALLDKIEEIINSQGSHDDEIASQHGTLVEDVDNEIEIEDELSLIHISEPTRQP
jgi:hypothetical protein